MAELRDFHGPNAAYVLDLYERWLLDPATVDEGWRSYFTSFTPPADAAPASPAPAAAGTGSGGDVQKALAAAELAHAVRGRGHTAARLNRARAIDSHKLQSANAPKRMIPGTAARR